MMQLTKNQPCGCDTFVAFPPATTDGVIIFGKNSDRPNDEGQSLRRYPRIKYFDVQENNGQQQHHNNERIATKVSSSSYQCQCTYISIPQAATTYAVLLSQIDWMWGAEMGANEYGVVIGNEAIWTKDDVSSEPEFLLGMDLVRLGLERASTAREALDVITTLLQTHGQGGACAENDTSFTYNNSYLIVDSTEAWVLETSGLHWVAQNIKSGIRNISNCLSIRSDFNLCSDGIKEYARTKGYWNGMEPFDFMKVFSVTSVEEETSDPRYCGAKCLLEMHANKGTMTKDVMISILRDHSSGICMHGGFETTSSWVSEIKMNGSNVHDEITSSLPVVTSSVVANHWATGKPHPCQNDFIQQDMFVSTSDSNT